MPRLVLIGAILSISLLMSGCQPPASGEAAGLSYPYLYWQLYNTPLAKNLNVPVQGVSHKQIQDTWGAARGQGRKHQGIDIFAKRGTPVLSATSGIVLDVGLNSLGGQVVWVMGPNLSRHYYAHLDAYAPDIQAGDWVEVGEVLGYVGNTGNAKNTPPHLHYGIYMTGKGAVNPYPYLTLNALK
ncbi:Peptidase M23 [Acinetobacter sp. 8I-beige]|uniref:M23 family metallopeptidase n=1 Tax=Acinetobacter sp. 8I-beige TaxID=2653125 RepID=UPI0012F027F3|nr:M23 family metallopeptidase [Acinetobacter sp. 8I-beige]VXA87592.1 Peptidase M23 [Acinetobacter sp. 8I-beige]